MPFFFLLFRLIILQKLVLLSETATTTTSLTNCTVSLGSILSPSSTSSWFSPSGRFAFGFYPQGNGFSIGTSFFISPDNTIITWTANRDDPPVSKNTTLILAETGLMLTIPDASESQDQSKSLNDISSPVYCASMLDSGKLVIYDSNSTVLWDSFNDPTDTLMSGQVLKSPGELFSSVSETNHSTGKFRLKMQNDGNLVMYPVETTDIRLNAYWSSGTDLQPYNILKLETNGSMVLISSNQTTTKNLTLSSGSNPGLVYRGRIGPEGLFQLYSHDLTTNSTKVLLALPPNDLCLVKGICGHNSYCDHSVVHDTNKMVCLCLPDYAYINPNDTHAGCQRNFTLNPCSSGEHDDNYTTMETLENIDWFTSTLSAPEEKMNQGECRDLCLKDCNCEAAILSDSKYCYKQTLPMIYGRRDETQTLLTFIKVRAGDPGGATTTTPPPLNLIKKEVSGVPLVVFLSAIAGLIVFFIVLFIIMFKSKVVRYRMIRSGIELAGFMDEMAPRSFSYHELHEATEGFKEELGRGAFGTVFKGTLPSTGRSVAVKRLEKVVEEGEREFQTEMKVIGRAHHRNLVTLLGFCNEGSYRLLVYEFMSNGSLADLIFRAEQNRPDWKERLRIALDVARGINYLHEDCETHIIHCDIKPQNILMDENWRAKIADFGLAKLLMPTQTRTFTGIRGTRGYLAPEWNKNVPITVKTDVYSFGIVLLEILCCRKNMELEVEVEEIILSEWVYSCYLVGELKKLILDEDNVDMVEFENMVKVGLWCIQTDPTLRPSMKNVITMLEGCGGIPSPPPP